MAQNLPVKAEIGSSGCHPCRFRKDSRFNVLVCFMVLAYVVLYELPKTMSSSSYDGMDLIKQYYATIFSMAYSSCGHYVAAGNNYGRIAIFNLEAIYEQNFHTHPDELLKLPFVEFQAHNAPVFAMASTKKLLLSGSNGVISGRRWSDLKKKQDTCWWNMLLPQGDDLKTFEVYTLAISCKENSDEYLVYAGCGDDTIKCIDMETSTVLFSLSGHTDYIHAIALTNDHQEIVSGGEDGSVRIWDTRKCDKETHIVEPFKHDIAARPSLGKWISCVAIDETDEWLVCGGAPVLCLWHLRSLLPAHQLLKQDAVSYVAHFHDDHIISGGSEACVNHWSLNGQLVTEVPTSASCLFDIKIHAGPTKEVLCAGGSSNRIDVCLDFRFREFSLVFP